MKFKSICLSSMLIYGLYAAAAYPEAVLTSKAYVDNKVPAYNSATESQSLLTDTTTTGTIAKRAIYSDTAANYDSTTQSTQIPTMGAVMSAISSATPSLPTGTAGNVVTYDTNGNIGGSVATYDASGTYTPATDAGKIATAAAVETKQSKIPASTNGYLATHSGTAGTFGTPVNPATFQSAIPAYASGDSASLLTDSETDGTVQKRAIFTDGTTYVAGTHATQIPTMGAVMSAVSAGTNAVDVSSHTVNGAPLSNSASYFYGTSSTAAATAQKEVSIPSITSLAAGQIIVVQPTVTSSVANSTIKLNDFDAYPMRYNNAAITTSSDSVVWSAAYPSTWVFDGTYWVFAGRGYDANSTYATMSVSEGTTGTATTAHSMRADYLKQIIQGTTLTGLSTSDATAVAATDSITTGIGKLQAQITDVAGDIPTLPTGTAGTAVLYDNNGNIGDERAISDAAVYTGTGRSRELSNGTNLATITAVETKQNAITAGTNGNLVEYNGADENGQALFTARSVMDDSDVADAISNSDGSWQGLGTEIRRNYTDGIVSGGAMGAALAELGQAVDALNAAVATKQNKATCTEYKPNSNNTICYAYTFADISAQSTKTQGEITEDSKTTK